MAFVDEPIIGDMPQKSEETETKAIQMELLVNVNWSFTEGVPNTFYLRATGISTAGSSGTNKLLSRANCQYATLYDANDGYREDFLAFSQPGRDNATAFTLDPQSRLIGVNSSYIMILNKSGSSNPVYFTAPDTFATYTRYAATNCRM
ncbi:hypothetical protein VSDG_01744 [Cytospora chrysosperma]|uniref:Uncharacterized protein n=1 Tax=Cytospora chrysosperma TaxID=252740 RepID=A0A423WH59_CYTCH|nr:hypothetical protein VSDG_01744 [Valsa sordida]